MKHYENIHTGEEVTLDTPEKIERFFDNRCPTHWVETERCLGEILRPHWYTPEIQKALREHGLPTTKPSQLADAFRCGWMAAKAQSLEIEKGN